MNEISSLSGYDYSRGSIVVANAACPRLWTRADRVVGLKFRGTAEVSEYPAALRRAHPRGYLDLLLEGGSMQRYDRATLTVEGQPIWLFHYDEFGFRRFTATRRIEQGMKFAPDEERRGFLSLVAREAGVTVSSSAWTSIAWREVQRLLPALSVAQIEDLAYAVGETWQQPATSKAA